MDTHIGPLSMAEVMDKSIDLYKKAFGAHLAFSAILATLYALGMVVLGIVVAIISPFDATLISLGVVVAFAFFVWVALSLTGHSLLTRQTYFNHRRTVRPGHLFPIALKVLSVILALLLVAVPFGLAVFGVIHGILIVTDNFWWALLIAYLVMFIALSIFANIIATSVTVAVFEPGAIFFTPIIRAFALVKGEFWKLAAANVLWLLALGAFYLSGFGIISMLVLGVTSLSDLVNIGLVEDLIYFAAAIFGLIFTTVVPFAVAPLYSIFQALLYLNQRIKKEGLDIEVQAYKLKNPFL